MVSSFVGKVAVQCLQSYPLQPRRWKTLLFVLPWNCPDATGDFVFACVWRSAPLCRYCHRGAGVASAQSPRFAVCASCSRAARALSLLYWR